MTIGKREAALQALLAVLSTVGAASVVRNDPLPIEAPSPDMIIIEDGDMGEPTIELSPVIYYWQHIVSVLLLVTGDTSAARDTMLDTRMMAIRDAILADTTLGGLVGDITLNPPELDSEAQDDITAYRLARMPIVLMYQTTSPTG